jgi:hypothetical protein
MLRGLRHWVDRIFVTKAPPTPEQAQQAAEQARQDRAGSIDDLRRDVRRLQQDIKDVSDSLASGITGAERTALEGRLASFQGELEQKQRELGRLQARV